MLFMRNFTYTECYPYIILPRRNVSYRKSVQYENELYEMLHYEMVLYEMLLYEMLLYEMLLIP